jgi:hypothetical protein
VVFRPQRRQAAAAFSDGGLSLSLSTGAFEFPAGSSDGEAVASPRAVPLSTQAAAEQQAVEDTAAAGASCGTSSDASKRAAAGAQEQECSTCTASLALWLPGRGCHTASDSDCEDDAVSRGCRLTATGATPAAEAAGATAPAADYDDEEEEEALHQQAAWLEAALRSSACGEPDVSWWLEQGDDGPDE